MPAKRADLKKKIAELEQRIQQLEARPAQEIHYHYWPQANQWPYAPYPGPWYPTVTWGGTGFSSGASAAIFLNGADQMTYT